MLKPAVHAAAVQLGLPALLGPAGRAREGTQVTIAMLTEPTSAQREAFELIGAPIPLTLK